MTTLLRREARVAGGALTGVGDTAIPTATAAIHGRTGAGPVTLRASRIAPIDLDPKSGIADSSRLPGLGVGCWAWQENTPPAKAWTARVSSHPRGNGPPPQRPASPAPRRYAPIVPSWWNAGRSPCGSGNPTGSGVGSPSRTAKRSADCPRTPKHTPMLAPAHTARSPHAGPVQSPDQERGPGRFGAVHGGTFAVGRSRADGRTNWHVPVPLYGRLCGDDQGFSHPLPLQQARSVEHQRPVAPGTAETP